MYQIQCPNYFITVMYLHNDNGHYDYVSICRRTITFAYFQQNLCYLKYYLQLSNYQMLYTIYYMNTLPQIDIKLLGRGTEEANNNM